MKEETKKLFDELFKRLNRIEQKLDETKPEIPRFPDPMLPPFQTTRYGCKVCGRNAMVDNYVCYNLSCPSRITTISSNTTGT